MYVSKIENIWHTRTPTDNQLPTEGLAQEKHVYTTVKKG